MRIAVVGGGPGGLFAGTLLKRSGPAHEVTVFERNRAEDTFGFGVVFSDATLAGIHAADPVLRTALTEHGGKPPTLAWTSGSRPRRTSTR
jgi:anthraniloyl-CoA monooxygenase